MGEVPLNGIPTSIATADNYLYIAEGESGLQVIDITTPAAPYIIGSLDTSGEATNIAVEGQYAYMAHEDGSLAIIDISAPASPVLVSSLAVTEGTDDGSIVVKDGYVYVTFEEYDTGMYIIDARDVENPKVAKTLSGSDLIDLAIAGNYLYTITRTALDVIDISTPESAEVVGRLRMADVNASTSADLSEVHVQGAYVYLATNESSANALYAINVSEPTVPAYVDGSAISLMDPARDMALLGDTAYIATFGGLGIYDISEPNSLIQIGLIDPFEEHHDFSSDRFPKKVTVAKGHAYFTTVGEKSFKVIALPSDKPELQ